MNPKKWHRSSWPGATASTSGTLLLTFALASAPGYAAEELNIMSWCDHSDPELLRPFEEKHDVRINSKDYTDTSMAQTLLRTSQPGDWDVLSLDITALETTVRNFPGLLMELDPADFPYDDIYPLMNSEDQYVDGKLYGVVEKFGYNAIAYNSNKVDPQDVRSYEIFWDENSDAKIGIFDLYFQQIQTVALVDGLKPVDITTSHLPAIKERFMRMKDKGVYIGDVVGVQTALVTGEIDILLGGAEWIVGSTYQDKPEIKWVIPDEGAIYYLLNVSIVADTKKPELAKAFAQYLLSPEAQAKLATSSCFWGLPVNTKAGEFLTEEQKQALHWESQEDYIARSHLNVFSESSEPDFDQSILDMWTEFLQK